MDIANLKMKIIIKYVYLLKKLLLWGNISWLGRDKEDIAERNVRDGAVKRQKKYYIYSFALIFFLHSCGSNQLRFILNN